MPTKRFPDFSFHVDKIVALTLRHDNQRAEPLRKVSPGVHPERT